MKKTTTAFAAVLCALLAAPSLHAALTAYYDFEGNFNDFPGAGAFVDDLVNQRPGAMIVSDPAAGPGGFAKGSTQSYAFDNRVADSRVFTAAHTADLTSTDQYTIMFWLKADDDNQALNNTRLATTRFTSSFAATSTVGAGNIGWQIEGFGQSASGNGPDLRIQGGAVGNFFARPANGSLSNDGDPNNDVWHHITFVISNIGSDANNRAYMETYLDGVSLGQNENTASTGTTLLRNLDGILVLGGHNVQGRSATGLMDDFALFDVVLTDQEILDIASGRLSPADFLPQGQAVPEPATATLALVGLAGLARRRRRA